MYIVALAIKVYLEVVRDTSVLRRLMFYSTSSLCSVEPNNPFWSLYYVLGTVRTNFHGGSLFICSLYSTSTYIYKLVHLPTLLRYVVMKTYKHDLPPTTSLGLVD